MSWGAVGHEDLEDLTQKGRVVADDALEVVEVEDGHGAQ